MDAMSTTPGTPVATGEEPAGPRSSRRMMIMTDNERVAVRLLRRMLSSRTTTVTDERLPEPGIAADALEAATPLMCQAFHRLDRSGTTGPQIADPEEPALTRDERGLLDALAAAQHPDDAVLDNYLIRLAPARAPRAQLAEAVRALADVLAASGRLLTSPSALCWSLPAAALTVARLHGYEPGLDAIDWPRS